MPFANKTSGAETAASASMDLNVPPFVLVIIGIIILWIGLAFLWDRKYRPARQKAGAAVASFNNILGRVLKFVFVEDKYPALKKNEDGTLSEELKYPKFGKFLVWRNFYLATAILSGVLSAVGNPGAGYLWAFLLLTIATRTNKVFTQRHSVLTRMFEVAAVELRYPRDANINPWGWVNIRKWERLTIPGDTDVRFPPAYKSEEQKNRENFERHFNGTVTDDNTWIYKWQSSKSVVSCAPVTHIPAFAQYPGSTHSEWNKIPVGVGTDGDVVWDVSVAPHALITGTTGGGKSTIQRNLIFHCIQHSDRWRFLGIDVKRVELSPYVKYDPVVMGIATNVEDGVEIIRYANEEMMNRYEQMEQLGVNHFKDLPEMPFALMVMIDESYMFLAPSGIKTDEGKEEDALKGEASKAIGDIARLGRAAGVHLVLATQRPDATVIYGELKQNLACRMAAGRMDGIASGMTLDNDNATRLPGNIKGRGYIQTFGEGEQFQGYFAPQNWIDEWLENGSVSPDNPSIEAAVPKKKSSKSLFGKKPAQKEIIDESDATEFKAAPKAKKSGGLLGRINAFNDAQAGKTSSDDENDATEPSAKEKTSKKAVLSKPTPSLGTKKSDTKESEPAAAIKVFEDEDPFGDDTPLIPTKESDSIDKSSLLHEIQGSAEAEEFIDPFGDLESDHKDLIPPAKATIIPTTGNLIESKPEPEDDDIFSFDDEEFTLFGPGSKGDGQSELEALPEPAQEAIKDAIESWELPVEPEPVAVPVQRTAALPTRPRSEATGGSGLPALPPKRSSSLPPRPSRPERPQRPAR